MTTKSLPQPPKSFACVGAKTAVYVMRGRAPAVRAILVIDMTTIYYEYGFINQHSQVSNRLLLINRDKIKINCQFITFDLKRKHLRL